MEKEKNWTLIFDYVFTKQEAGIQKYKGTDSMLKIPAKLEGRKITRLAAYAFAECRALQEIQLPETISFIGKHAFYNCRGLTKIIMPGSYLTIEDGAFKNCSSLKEIVLFHGEKNKIILEDILFSINYDVLVTIHYEHGQSAVLFFPGYEYEFVANEPARISSEVGHGAGYLYHQCFFHSDIDYQKYDAIFASSSHMESLETNFTIAVYRLKFPYQLEEKPRKQYIHFLITYYKELTSFLCQKELLDLLSFLTAEIHIFNRDMVDTMIFIAQSWKKAAFVSYLLDYQETYTKREKRDYEL